MIQPDAVVDFQSLRQRSCEDMLAVWAPFTNRRVASLDRGDLRIVTLEIIDIHMAIQVPKSTYEDETTVWREKNRISWSKWKGMCGDSLLVEYDRLGWHIAVYNTKLFAVR